MNESSLIILLAVLIDVFFREPVNRFHPVVAMGRCIEFGRKRVPATGPVRQFCWGGLIVVVGISFFALIGWLFVAGCQSLPDVVSVVLQAVVLKLTFSVRSLMEAGRSVLIALQKNDLPAARHWLGWHLVSRHTENLNESEVAGAAIESVIENLTDSLIAPLCWYVLGGLPAALAYRYINTCDAMIGYRTSQYEWLGKPTARIDDVMNYIPARLATIFLWVSVLVVHEDSLTAIRIWWRDHSKTSSPNAGQTMSLVAGGLGVMLEKRDVYQLGAGLRLPTVDDLQRSLLLFGIAALLFIATSLGTLILWERLA